MTLSKGENSIKSLPDLCGPEFQLLRGTEDTGIDLGNCLRRNGKACQHPGLGSRVGGLWDVPRFRWGPEKGVLTQFSGMSQEEAAGPG